MSNRRLYTRWVLANALAEMFGLGATLVLDYLIIARSGDPSNWAQALVSILLFAATGVIEGIIVGLAQGWVLRTRFAWLRLRDWVQATTIGAVVAWALGSLPSTFMGMNASSTPATAPVQEPSQALVLLLAAGMGAVLGVVLSFFQWRVLRKQVANAASWIPANSLAWAAGMPVIFAVMNIIQVDSSPAQIAATLAFALYIAGAVVGAIHGLWLVRFREIAAEHAEIAEKRHRASTTAYTEITEKKI